MLKYRVGNILAKSVVDLRINLNLDGTPITSKSHTHPSHSHTSRLLTSSLSVGVPVFSWDITLLIHNKTSKQFPGPGSPRHPRMSLFGSSSDPSINVHLHYPNYLDGSLNEVVVDKIRQFHTHNSSRPSNSIQTLSLGVPVPHTTQCIRDVYLPQL
jgi:hypothetical protein